MPAGIFGSDAVATQPAVNLPTNTEGWFKQGGAGTNGTQVPDYWLNKFGGELVNLIESGGGALDMHVDDQIATIITTIYNNVVAIAGEVAVLQAGLATTNSNLAITNSNLAALQAAVQNTQPVIGSLNTNLLTGGGANTTYSFNLSLTAPANGFIIAVSGLTASGPLAANASLNSKVSIAGSGVSSVSQTSDFNPEPQTEFGRAAVAVASGNTVIATFSVTTNNVAPMQEFQQDGLLFFMPNPI